MVTYKEANEILQLQKLKLGLNLEDIDRVKLNKVGIIYGVEIPQTDGEVVYLPREVELIKEKAENVVLDKNTTIYAGFLFHELAHIIYKSMEVDLKEFVESFENKEVARMLLNSLEDARIHNLFRQEFAQHQGKVLDSVTKYLLSRIKYQDPEALTGVSAKLVNVFNFSLMLQSLLLYKKFPSRFVSKDSDTSREVLEKKFLEQKINVKELNDQGIYTVRDLLNYSYRLAKPLVEQGYSVLDTAKITRQIYDLVVKAFDIRKEDSEALKKEYDKLLEKSGCKSGFGPGGLSSDMDVEKTAGKPKIQDVEKDPEQLKDLRQDIEKRLREKGLEPGSKSGETGGDEDIVGKALQGYSKDEQGQGSQGQGSETGKEDLDKEIEQVTRSSYGSLDIVQRVLKILQERKGYHEDILLELGAKLREILEKSLNE
ncbi:hypothetical protein J7L02_01420 [Candidatus Woesearchaeota archaeon]|nr:hypothetical protein [Candidatus Woesearchaeota archaeon]